MTTRPTRLFRSFATVLLASLPAWAQGAYLPNWTQQNYSISQYIQAGAQSDSTDITVNGIGALPLSGSISVTGSGSAASGTSILGFANGTFNAYLAPIVSSTNASQYGYAISGAGVDNRFTATSSTLYVNYLIDGLLNVVNPANAQAYAAFSAGFFVEDVLLGFNSRQTFEWAYLYDDKGSVAVPILAKGTSTVQLTPGRTYQFALDLWADSLSNGTSNAGWPATISFSFSDTAASVSEPSGAALMALGLLGFAGTLQLRRKRQQ